MSVSELRRATGEIVVLRLCGEADIATVPRVRSTLAAVLARRPSHAILDLSGLTFCSVRGATVLLEAAAVAAELSIAFSVAAPSRVVLRSWELMGPAGGLPVRHRTVGAAMLAAADPPRRTS